MTVIGPIETESESATTVTEATKTSARDGTADTAKSANSEGLTRLKRSAGRGTSVVVVSEKRRLRKSAPRDTVDAARSERRRRSGIAMPMVIAIPGPSEVTARGRGIASTTTVDAMTGG